MSDYELDEVDAFSANRETVLLSNAGKYAAQNAGDESSEEEVMGIDEDDSDEEAPEDDEDDEIDEIDEVAEEEEEEGWGGRKNYYGGEEIEDMKLMTEEAMKQQKKHLQDLAMDDYIDEDVMDEWKKTSKTEAASARAAETTKMLFSSTAEGSTGELSAKEKVGLLKQQFPEFVPLLEELKGLKQKLVDYEGADTADDVASVKRIALSAYLAAISSYFAIFVESMQADEGFNSMKESPVMESILSAKEVWRQASELNEVSMHSDEEELEGELEGGEELEAQEGELMEEDSEDDSDSEVDPEKDSDSDETLVEDIDISVKRTASKKSRKSATGDFSETATPHEVDLEDKTRRKKTLRFYTSRIDQAATKNSNSERFAGDLDLPYKERLFERQQRLVEEARKRGMEQRDELGGDFSDDDGAQMDIAEDVRTAGEDEYYHMIKQKKSDKKDARMAAHEEAVQAAKEGKLAELQESVDDDGKRAVNFQILKNKGLTPKRHKDNRNARVKKRKKYEKAQKKLKSVRQVYDDSNRGPYGGEKTGIKKGITRSVKLV